MIYIDAARLSTLVTAAGAFLRTSLLAARVVSFRDKLAAVELPVHVTAPTFHLCSVWTRRTRARVAEGRACVRCGRSSTFEFDPASEAAGGHGVQAGGSRLHPVPLVQLLQPGLTARAGRHSGGGEDAGEAGAAVAHGQALVVLTVQSSLTD